MSTKRPPGLFITGTDTSVGKTHVACCIVRALAATGKRVGVYKPAASGGVMRAGVLQSEDALALWEAAGRPGELSAVCPQVFAAPLAPHLAARAAGCEINFDLLRSGLDYWCSRSDILIVEGAGGLMSPLGDEDYVADLAFEFALPLIVVAANRIGVINQTLQTLVTAAAFRDGIPVAGVVLNHPQPPVPETDPSVLSNARELSRHSLAPLLSQLAFGATDFENDVDWWELAQMAD